MSRISTDPDKEQEFEGVPAPSPLRRKEPRREQERPAEAPVEPEREKVPA